MPSREQRHVDYQQQQQQQQQQQRSTVGESKQSDSDGESQEEPDGADAAAQPAARVKKPLEDIMYFAGYDKGRTQVMKVNDDEFLDWERIGSRTVVMVEQQVDALAATNSTVYRTMATSPPRNRAKTPERQQLQQQQQQQQQTHLQALARNSNITLMNLRSPLAAVDWRTSTATERVQCEHEGDDDDDDAAAGAAAAGIEEDVDDFLLEGEAAARNRSLAPEQQQQQQQQQQQLLSPSAFAALGSIRTLTVTVNVPSVPHPNPDAPREALQPAAAAETPSPTLHKGRFPAIICHPTFPYSPCTALRSVCVYYIRMSVRKL
jgi:hypothetical protein